LQPPPPLGSPQQKSSFVDGKEKFYFFFYYTPLSCVTIRIVSLNFSLTESSMMGSNALWMQKIPVEKYSDENQFY
jgi:hypothetical protein